MSKPTKELIEKEFIRSIQEEIARCGLRLVVLEMDGDMTWQLSDAGLYYVTLSCKELGGDLAIYISRLWRPFFHILPWLRGPYSRSFGRGSYDWRKAVLTRLNPDPDLKEDLLNHLFIPLDIIEGVHPMHRAVVIQTLKQDIRDHPEAQASERRRNE